MARKTKTQKNPEQRRAEMEALHDQLAEGVEQLRSSERWAAYLNFCTGFHRYSFANVILIWRQCPEAAAVAGYRAWQAKGRQVRKGERGLRILGTGTVRTSADDDDADGEPAEDGRRRIFFPVSVFDIAQTDLAEGAEDASTVADELTGEDEAGILARVVDYLTAEGVPVELGNTAAGVNGYTAPANADTGEPVRVMINDQLEPAQQAKTALHEAAHITLGHLDDDHAEYLAHRGRYEVEAESVAYVLAGILGADTSAYSIGYVAGWAERAETDVIKSTATRVLKAAHTLADALAPADAAELQAA
ncbi:MAG: ArdC-like ssDNA-binding domain-containing protein [Microbacterium sp.]|uniref:ArdC-like ssDNA-binding domain-containing protein n=1 Tax=Microbacterium sp. TaxID=51671 RepID=UPI003F9A980D